MRCDGLSKTGVRDGACDSAPAAPARASLDAFPSSQ